jgi:hypothetical protein
MQHKTDALRLSLESELQRLLEYFTGSAWGVRLMTVNIMDNDNGRTHVIGLRSLQF